jgi:hypothetical protein
MFSADETADASIDDQTVADTRRSSSRSAS